jgi:hypothetical protein
MRLTVIALALAAAACTTQGAPPAMPTSYAPPPSSQATTAQEEIILKVVDRFLLAVGNHDAEALDELVIVEGVSWFQHVPPAGAEPVEPFRNADLLTPEPDADPFIERYWDPEVRIRGGLAQVWAPYELRDNGQQVHCGIDAFDLVFLDGQWRVASLLSSTEPGGCDALMPDSPASMRPRDGWKETRNE